MPSFEDLEGFTALAHKQDPYADAGKLIVQFHVKAVKDEAASAEAGRPIFKEEEYIRIFVPGDRDVVDRPIYPSDLQRFANQYERWKSKKGTEEVVGTPLEQYPMISRAQVEELKYFNVFTVEQLANMADVHTQKFMGINTLRQQARDWLAVANKTADASKMRKEIELRDAEIGALKDMLKKQGEQIEKLQKRL